MAKIVVGYWDCKYCGTNGVKGTIRDCPNCGRPRDENVTFYLKKQKEYLDDETSKKVNKNPDWVCEFCDSLNPDSSGNCLSCGAPREVTSPTYFEVKEKEKQKESKEVIDEVDFEKSEQVAYEDFSTIKNDINTQYEEKIKEDVKPKKINIDFYNIFCNLGSIFGGIISIAALILIVYFIVSGLISLFTPKEEIAKVTELSWQRDIDISKLKTFNESDWNLPSGARLISQKSEIYSYENKLSHYETKTRLVTKTKQVGVEVYDFEYKDLGNGLFEEIEKTRPVYETYTVEEKYQEPVYISVPIYKIKYYYEIDRWVHERYITTSGNTKDVYWGEENLLENEKVSGRKETYKIKVLTEEEKEYNLNLPYDKWLSLEVNQEVVLKVTLGTFAELKE